MSAQQRILVRGVNWLGDAVMSIPALQRLREAHPESHITLLTSEKLADLWTGSPWVDSTMPFGAKESIWSVGRRIRAGKFHLSVIFPNSHRSALESWLGGVPRRIGVGRTGLSWLLTDVVSRYPGYLPMRKRSADEIQQCLRGNGPREQITSAAHHIHQYLHLVSTAGASKEPVAPTIPVSDEEMQQACVKFNISRTSRLVFGLNAGAEYGPAKRWPLDSFAAMAREVNSRTHCHWLLLGGQADAERANALEGNLRSGTVSNLAGRTTLRELCAVMRACRVVVSNDTGPMHLAAAVGARVVALFGSTSPELTGPGLPGDARHLVVHSEVACRPCFLRECPIDLRCLRSIGASQVADAVLSLVG